MKKPAAPMQLAASAGSAGSGNVVSGKSLRVSSIDTQLRFASETSGEVRSPKSPKPRISTGSAGRHSQLEGEYGLPPGSERVSSTFAAAPSYMTTATTKKANHSSRSKARDSKSSGRATVFKDSQSVQAAVEQQLEEERREEAALKDANLAKASMCTWCIRTLVNSQLFISLMTVLTLYALVSDDLRLIHTSKPADDLFNLLTSICIILFVLEILLSCKGKKDYSGSFFFTLDCVSTATLLLDLTFVNEALLQGDGEDMTNLGASNTALVGARAARVVRVLRLVRLIKLYKAIYEVHAAKQKKAAQNKKAKRKKKKDQDEWTAEDEDVDSTSALVSESQVSKKLSDMTTRRVIAIVLTMMLGLPTLGSEQLVVLPTSAAYGADTVLSAFKQMQLNASRRDLYERTLLQYIYYHNWYSNRNGCLDPDNGPSCPSDYYQSVFWVGIGGRQEDLVKAVAEQGQVTAAAILSYEESILSKDRNFDVGPLPAGVISNLGSPWNSTCRTKGGMLRRGRSLLDSPAELSGFSSATNRYVVQCPEDLRSVERMKYIPQFTSSASSKEWHFAFYVDTRPFVALESELNIITTVFISVVLLVFSICITSDANSMVLRPVESMMLKVDMIRIDPLMATKLADDAFKKEEIDKAKAVKAQRSLSHRIFSCLLCHKEKHGEPMETLILEKTIIKLGTLLALGFGEAGANIIGQNMKSNGSIVNAMIPGVQVECIIGSARIREFEIATEILKVTVMQFVNQVAEIVHGVVDAFHGAANANKGDTFLLVWPCGEYMHERLKSKMADMSIMALVRIWAAVHRSYTLAGYRVHPGLQRKMRAIGTAPRVNLGFGLHYGWAIEGAVGSEFKIDASYLSPNVNIAETVERATEVYGVNLMITEAVMKMCTPEMAEKGRLVDHVHMQGQKVDVFLRLHVIDLSYLFLKVEPPLTNQRWNTRQRFRCRQQLEVEKMYKINAEVHMVSLFNSSLEVNAMRAPFTLEFMCYFRMGYENFSQGEWKVARRILENTCTMLGFEDGPSLALLRYMEKPYDFECPEGWQGVRTLLPSGHPGEPVLKHIHSNHRASALEQKETRRILEGKRHSLCDEADGLRQTSVTSRTSRSSADFLAADLAVDVPIEEKPIGTAERKWR